MRNTESLSRSRTRIFVFVIQSSNIELWSGYISSLLYVYTHLCIHAYTIHLREFDSLSVIWTDRFASLLPDNNIHTQNTFIYTHVIHINRHIHIHVSYSHLYSSSSLTFPYIHTIHMYIFPDYIHHTRGCVCMSASPICRLLWHSLLHFSFHITNLPLDLTLIPPFFFSSLSLHTRHTLYLSLSHSLSYRTHPSTKPICSLHYLAALLSVHSLIFFSSSLSSRLLWSFLSFLIFAVSIMLALRLSITYIRVYIYIIYIDI